MQRSPNHERASNERLVRDLDPLSPRLKAVETSSVVRATPIPKDRGTELPPRSASLPVTRLMA